MEENAAHAGRTSAMLWLKRGLLAIALLSLLLLGAVGLAYWTIPERNTNIHRFDALIVLGSPANPDGTPGPEQRLRTLESVGEYKAGKALRIIMTGGAAHNRYVESEVMAAIAVKHGVPQTAIFEDKRSKNTIQNIFYAMQIMRRHGWRSAEIISSASHLPRASLIVRRYPIQWQMHASPWPPSYSAFYPWSVYAAEAMYCTKLRLLGFHHSAYLPQ